MSLYAFITGLTSLSFLLTGMYVYAQDQRKLLYQRCFRFSTSVAFWAFGYFITLLEISNYEINITASRLSHAFGAFIPITYLHFVWAILKKEDRKKFFFWSYLFSTFMFFVCLTPLVVTELLPKMGIKYYPEGGIFYAIYALLFLVYPGYAQYKMAVEIRKTRGTERMRLIYFFVALALAFSGGVSLFLLIFNLQFPPYLSVLIILYPPMMAYTILVYRFLDIQVIIRRTLVFAGLLGMVMLTMTVVMALAQGIASHYVSVPPMVVTAITALIAIALYDRTRQFLVDLTDKFLFQKKFDYRRLLKDASRGVALIKSLDRLAKLIVAFMTMRARIKSAALFINTDGEGFQLKTARGFTGKTLEKISDSHPLIQRLRGQKQPLRKTDFVSSDGISDHESREIYSLLSELKAEAVIPSFLGRGGDGTSGRDRLSLRGFLILGAKKSDEEYTQDDLDVFSTLAQESAIAIENARLYDAQIQKTNELAKANEELAFTNKKLNDATSDLMKALSETERAKKELESTQAQMLDMKRRELVARMSAAMGHEIQNPLQGISFTYYHFGKLGKILHEILEYAKEIGDSKIIELTDRTITIVNQDIAQPLRNHTDRIKGIANSVTDLIKGQDRFADIHLGLIINYAIEEIRFTTYWERLSEPTIEINLPRNLPLVHANSHRLQGVFVNLIKNAYDAMKGRAEKHITIRGEDDPENPALIRIYFEDSGCGMNEEIAKHAFDFKFTTKGDHGTGIGLAYCKDTIEAHGGTISLKTEPGKGAIFVFTLKKGKPYGVGGDKYEKDVGHRR